MDARFTALVTSCCRNVEGARGIEVTPGAAETPVQLGLLAAPLEDR
jgi:hypothetical protein